MKVTFNESQVIAAEIDWESVTEAGDELVFHVDCFVPEEGESGETKKARLLTAALDKKELFMFMSYCVKTNDKAESAERKK